LYPGGHVVKWGAGGVDWDGIFYHDMGETSLDFLTDAEMSARLACSMFLTPMDDILLVTGLGYAVYYTSATPSDGSTDLEPPVPIPEGQGVAWSFPSEVEARPAQPANNGAASGTAGPTLEYDVELYAGQAPDDVLVPTAMLQETDDYTLFRMTAPELFGGEKREGGLQGDVVLYAGTETQESDAYLSAQLGLTAPAYCGLCHAVLKRPYLGTSNYLKNLNFVLARYPSNLGLPASVTRIGRDANPAEIIYDAMTNTRWGLARLATRFDLNSWQVAAIRLASEGMGMSLLWDNEAEAQDLIEDVLRHIDGVIQTDPQTGLWTLTLIRAVDPAGLLELTEDDLLEAPEFTRGSWEETWNEVKVNFIDGETYKRRTVQAHDSANVSITGAVKTQTLDFLGFSNPVLAQKVAMRELKTHSYPFAKVHLKSKRKAWPLRIGSPFKMSYAPTGISVIVLRVLAIDYGRFEQGIIEIDAVEDAFSVAYSAFDSPEDSVWVDPIGDPQPPVGQLLVEAPFEWLQTPAAEEKILAGASRADESSSGFEIQADEGSGYFKGNTGERFAPSGLLAADYSRKTAALDPTGFTLESGRDLDDLEGTDEAGRLRGDCLLLFEDTGEICAFQTVIDNEDGTWTLTNIVRGVYDTFPADHPEGTRVFIIRDAGTPYLFPYRADETSDAVAGDQFIVEED
jgi:hypothetical protein